MNKGKVKSLTIRGCLKVSSKELFKWEIRAWLRKGQQTNRSGVSEMCLMLKLASHFVAVTFSAGVSGQLLGVQLLNPLWGEMQLVAQTRGRFSS